MPLQNAGQRVGPELRGRGEEEFFVYERPNPLPRAFVVPNVQVEDSDEMVLSELTNRASRFDRRALVTAADFGSGEVDNVEGTPAREVRFTRDEPTAIVLDIAAGDARWLVLTDTFLAGWRASIDGEPVPLRRCNHAQRLVQLPEKACVVAFDYTSPLLGYGFSLFALGIAGLAAAYVIGRRSSAVPAGDEKAG